ncbi:hypothetical protein BaRGS_00028693 [Batillaria attramentaria]|uniref:Uncharacterized protein n=1 Tax=Batillaria attramentaria TaxID=370345 RepID=A0ABD0JZ32_9CAEN
MPGKTAPRTSLYIISEHNHGMSFFFCVRKHRNTSLGHPQLRNSHGQTVFRTYPDMTPFANQFPDMTSSARDPFKFERAATSQSVYADISRIFWCLKHRPRWMRIRK